MLRKLSYYAPGTGMILLGILVVAFPALLVALVAAMLIVIGIGTLYAAHHVRKLHEELGQFDDPLFSGILYDPYLVFERSFFSRPW